jgi:hypothetical protein
VIWPIGDDMTLHDANITRFGQWWRRMVRSGYAFTTLHGASAGTILGLGNPARPAMRRFGDNCRVRNGDTVGLLRIDEPTAPVGNNVDTIG